MNEGGHPTSKAKYNQFVDEMLGVAVYVDYRIKKLMEEEIARLRVMQEKLCCAVLERDKTVKTLEGDNRTLREELARLKGTKENAADTSSEAEGGRDELTKSTLLHLMETDNRGVLARAEQQVRELEEINEKLREQLGDEREERERMLGMMQTENGKLWEELEKTRKERDALLNKLDSEREFSKMMIELDNSQHNKKSQK